MFEHSQFFSDRAQRLDPIDTGLEETATNGEAQYSEAMGEHLNKLWDIYGLQERIEALSGYLGQSQMVSSDIEIAPGVPSVIQIGSRVNQCLSTLPIEGTDIQGFKGNIVFYRTRVSSNPDQFHEAGFFCFLLALPDQSGQTMMPSIVYGDLDSAEWTSEAAKLKLAELLAPPSSSDQDTVRARFNELSVSSEKKRVEYGAAVIQSLFAQEEVRRKNTVPCGVLRQNETLLLGAADASEVLQVGQQVTEAMQHFIDFHFLPDQTRTPLVERPPLADPEEARVPKICRSAKLVNHISWSQLLVKEFVELPYLQAIKEVSWGRKNLELSWVQAKDVLTELHTGSVAATIAEVLYRSELTNEEIITVHRIYGTYNKAAWKWFVSEFPHLYPSVTLETIAAKYPLTRREVIKNNLANPRYGHITKPKH